MLNILCIYSIYNIMLEDILKNFRSKSDNEILGNFIYPTLSIKYQIIFAFNKIYYLNKVHNKCHFVW